MWVALSLAAALLQAGQFAVVKARARHLAPIVIVLWAQMVGVAASACWVLGRPTPFLLPTASWRWIVAAAVLAVAMTYLLARGTARGDVSIVGPLLALSPVFTVIPDWLVSGTLPRGVGWVGIALSVTGAVAVTSTGRDGGRRSAFREDAVCGLGAAIVLGALSAVDRRNAAALGVPTYLLALYATMTVLLALVVALTARREFLASLTRANVLVLVVHGVLAVAGTAMQTSALTFAPAAYVNSVRRSSSVFSVVLGRAVFGEPAVARRLAGAALLAIGTACFLLAR